MKKIIIFFLFPFFLQAQVLYVGSGANFYVKSSTLVKANGGIQNEGTLIDNGLVEYTQNLTNNGTLQGTGTLTVGAGTWSNGASSSIAPGNSIGILSVTGDFAPSSSVFNIELGSTVVGTGYDQFNISGAATLTNATLNVTLVNGFVPSDGDSFTVLDAAMLNGGFSSTNLPTVGGTISWGISYNSGNGTATLVASGASVLPIELLDFRGRVAKETVVLNWKTALEQNIRNFDIERSKNGFDFQPIGTSRSKGSNSFYTFIDEHPFQERNYYRLKINDLDGSVSYSKIEVVMIDDKTFNIKVYPTLVTDVLNLQTEGGEINEVMIVNVAGQVLYQQAAENLSHQGFMQLDLSDLPSATYFIKAKNSEGNSNTIKFIKK